jgi:hypothetical protein
MAIARKDLPGMTLADVNSAIASAMGTQSSVMSTAMST